MDENTKEIIKKLKDQGILAPNLDKREIVYADTLTVKKELKVGDILDINSMRPDYTYVTILNENLEIIIEEIQPRFTPISITEDKLEQIKKAWADPSQYSIKLIPEIKLSDRAREWQIVAFINMANQAIHRGSLSPQERPLVLEIAEFYLDDGNLTRFQDMSLKDIKKRLET